MEFARGRNDTDKATYHVSATVGAVPARADVPDDRELERLYLELWAEVQPGRGFTAPSRQILHCTFGSVLTHQAMGSALPGRQNAPERRNAMNSEGILEVTPEGWGFLRRTVGAPSDQDAYVSQHQIQRFRLRAGDAIRGEVRPPRVHEGEKYYGLWKIETINDQEP